MQAAGVTLSISGHHHEGAATTRDGGITYVHAPALCEAPFTFIVITLDNSKVTTQRHTLVQPETAHIVDTHVHTQLAYCAEDVSVEAALSLAGDVELGGVGFAEHAGQLYFDRQAYWSRACLRDGIETAREDNDRMDDYLELKRTHAGERRWFGLEVGCDHQGNMLLKPEDRLKVDYLIGSIHSMPGLTQDAAPGQHVHETFLFMTERILTSGVVALAHPFRIFRRSGWAPPPALFQPVAELLRRHGVAAELNFHTNEPPLDFVRRCLDHGVRFTFGSDAHRLDEVGDFAYHLALLHEAGFDGELADVLAPQALVPGL
jgi:histidinol phosphatase-like PHP family hydrolase